MLDREGLKFAIDDARLRQAGLLKLISGTERQAMSLLNLYVTLGLASASGSAAALSQTVKLPAEVGFALGAALLTFSAGAAFCFQAMKFATLGLPGRGAEFWIWAHEQPDVDFIHAVGQYLAHLKERQEKDRELNRVTALALRRAKLCGVLAPCLALVVGAAAAAVRFY